MMGVSPMLAEPETAGTDVLWTYKYQPKDIFQRLPPVVKWI